ncbi:hypothetical protein L345_11722, partial [Ophiophagus hannah]
MEKQVSRGSGTRKKKPLWRLCRAFGTIRKGPATRANALSQKHGYIQAEHKVLPWTVILLEKFTVTQTPVDFKRGSKRSNKNKTLCSQSLVGPVSDGST